MPVLSLFIGLEVDPELRPDRATVRLWIWSAWLVGRRTGWRGTSDDAASASVVGDLPARQRDGDRRRGLMLISIGHLVNEAEEVIVTTGDGNQVPAMCWVVDFSATGFRPDPRARTAEPAADAHRRPVPAEVGSGGGRGRRRRAGTCPLGSGDLCGRALPDTGNTTSKKRCSSRPAHPHWSGAALISPNGDLIGVGSLRMEQMRRTARSVCMNMFVLAELPDPNPRRSRQRARKAFPAAARRHLAGRSRRTSSSWIVPAGRSGVPG